VNYGLVITEKDNAFVGKGIPPTNGRLQQWQTVLAKQYLCLADLAVDGFANSLETIWGQKFPPNPKVPEASV